MSKDVNIPEKLNDITLRQWQELTNIDESAENEMYIRRVLNIIYGISGGEVAKIKSTDIEKLINAVKSCTNEKPKFEQKFELDGVKYGIIPNFDDITFGELVDLDTYSDKDKYHLLMSILYRPIVKEEFGRYEIEPYRGSKDMGSMPVGIALGSMAFFLTIATDLINSILSSLTEEEKEMASQQGFIKNGVGLPLSIPYVMDVFWTKIEF